MKNEVKSSITRDYILIFTSFFVIYIITQSIIAYNLFFSEGSTLLKVPADGSSAPTSIRFGDVALYFILPMTLMFAIYLAVSAFTIRNYKTKLRKINEFIDTINSDNLGVKITENFHKTELRNIAFRLNDMIDRIDRSFSHLRQFTSTVSHELKTPLTIIRGELEIALHSRKTEEEYQAIIASSLDEVLRLNNVVMALLDLSRADTGKFTMNVNRENISKLLEDIAEDAVILAESKEITVTSKIEKDVFARCDIARLHQAFLNIVDNAIKYSPDKGRIDIELKSIDKFVEVSFADSGYGIPQDAIPNIFDRFYRINDSSPGHSVQGSGLGLSIVKWIVDSHNGKIVVNSIEKQGTKFTILLPAN